MSMLQRDISALEARLTPAKKSLIEVEQCRSRFADIFRAVNFSHVNSAKAVQFGSWSMGLGREGSDVDIAVSLDLKPMTKENKVTALKQISNHLRCIGYNNDFYPEAPVPLIKVRCSPAVDIIVLDEYTRNRTKFMLAKVESDPAVARLTRVVRHWAGAREVGKAGKGGISSFAWSLLAIRYLQWSKNGGNADLSSLFVGFFRFYTQSFDPENHCISVKNGERDSGIPSNKQWNQKKFRSGNAFLQIEDPVDQDDNVARAVDKKSLDIIFGELRRAHKLLAARKSLNEICAPVKGSSFAG